MQIKESMSKTVEFVPLGTNLMEAAQRMSQLDCGFLPVGDPEERKLKGIVTDRDITVRAVARGFDPADVPVEEIMTDEVLYCYEDDLIEEVADNMRTNGVYRLIVLDDKEAKQLSGVVSLGDMARWHDEFLVGHIVKGINV